MKSVLTRRPSPALVVACIALVAGAGGTAVASSLITSAQIKNHTIKTQDLSSSALRSLRGKAGPAGVTGATGAQGPQGPKGDTGPAGPFVTSLPSGQTLRGVFAVRGSVASAGQDMQGAITFAFPLATAPTTHYIAAGVTPPAECPGNASTPEAAPGHLCVYESAVAINGTGRVFDPSTSAAPNNVASRFGVGVAVTAAAAGDMRVRGTWAVTAP